MPVTRVKSKWVDGNLEFRDDSENIIAVFDGVNRKLTIPTGSTIDIQSGATFTIADGALETPDLAVPNGKIIVGNASGKGADVTMSGDTTIDNAGAVTIGAAKVLSSMNEEGLLRSIKKQLTNANVLALATGAGIEVIAAPGADKAIIVHALHIVSDASNTAWTEPSAPDDLVLQYADGVDISGAIEASALIANSVNIRKYGVLDTELVPDVNAAVNLFNSGSNWGGGNAANTMSLRVWYSVVSTVAFS